MENYGFTSNVSFVALTPDPLILLTTINEMLELV